MENNDLDNIEEVEEFEEDTQKDKYLTFVLGEETYAIGIEFVIEIIGIQPITQVPELPKYISGIINLRGKIIPVMDVRMRFKKPYREYTDRTCVVVVEINGSLIGLIVDSVADVLAIPELDIVKTPEIKKAGNKYIKFIGKVDTEVKLILDCDRLLNDEEWEAIIQIEE